MSISTYFKPNIHQNGPEILGVKIVYLRVHASNKMDQTYDFAITSIIYLRLIFVGNYNFDEKLKKNIMI
jgi:hypothetical protein